jgi:hypothetical protein
MQPRCRVFAWCAVPQSTHASLPAAASDVTVMHDHSLTGADLPDDDQYGADAHAGLSICCLHLAKRLMQAPAACVWLEARPNCACRLAVPDTRLIAWRELVAQFSVEGAPKVSMALEHASIDPAERLRELWKRAKAQGQDEFAEQVGDSLFVHCCV